MLRPTTDLTMCPKLQFRTRGATILTTPTDPGNTAQSHRNGSTNPPETAPTESWNRRRCYKGGPFLDNWAVRVQLEPQQGR